MMDEIRFEVPGVPMGKGRARTVRLKNGASHSYTPNKTTSYESLIKLCFMNAVGPDFIYADGQYMLRVIAFLPVPKSKPKKWQQLALAGKIRPTKKPDFDNIGKIVADSLNGIAYRDDSAIVDGWVRKFYGEQPKLIVVLSEVVDDSYICSL